MDPRDRAEATLARARARGAFVVTPDDAVSPMDAANTLQIPRAVVDALDSENPDSTMVIPADTANGQQPTQPLPPRQPAQSPALAEDNPNTQPLPAAAQKPLTRHIQPVIRPSSGEPPAARRPAPPEEENRPQQPREMGGLVPTVQQPGTQRSMLSRRLDGSQ
ncbi:MAG TPA: hypothetical protein VG756_15070 [Pseudonocardiaceae bacterium]|jgi:hypothetical protein|nr:hypothetical protein [Pseudonocardiaceae bacterium]